MKIRDVELKVDHTAWLVMLQLDHCIYSAWAAVATLVYHWVRGD